MPNLSSKIATVDGDKNSQYLHVIGNKNDTTSGDSLVSLVKTVDGVVDTIATSTTTTIPGTISTIDGYHDVPTADAATNTQMRDVIGNKTDTTGGDSLVALVKIADAAVDTIDGYHDVPSADSADNAQMRDVIGNKTDTTAGDSLIAMSKSVLARETELVVTKTATGNGATTVNIVDLTGTVHIEEIWGEITEATDITTLQKMALVLDDSTTTADITESATGTDCSAKAVGSILKREAVAGTAITLIDNAAGAVDDGVPLGITVTKKTAAATSIAMSFTGDANTDVDICWVIRYRPVSNDGALAASA